MHILIIKKKGLDIETNSPQIIFYCFVWSFTNKFEKNFSGGWGLKNLQPTPVATSQLKKDHFYTEEEDIQILQFSKQEDRESKAGGVVIFKQLAKQMPQHTWQSI